MSYFDDIRQLTTKIPMSIVDFSEPRNRNSAPTQASSNFITNKEQGDWAEDIIFRAINETSKNYVAVRYGRSDDLIAGEKGFQQFYNKFQDELDTIGKRPDLLIFKKEDFDLDLGYDISKIDHAEIIEYVKISIAGLEIRSSAFLIDKYETEMQTRTDDHLHKAIQIRDKILNDYSNLLETPRKKHFIEILNSINKETINAVSFRKPNWNSTNELQKLTELFKELKENITIVQKRDYLSITPKIEDLKVVYKWTETFNVPHYYFQVFFDKSYGISFKNILSLITESDKEGEYY